MRQIPFEGCHTATLLIPSPSKSPRSGTSPLIPRLLHDLRARIGARDNVPGPARRTSKKCISEIVERNVKPSYVKSAHFRKSNGKRLRSIEISKARSDLRRNVQSNRLIHSVTAVDGEEGQRVLCCCKALWQRDSQSSFGGRSWLSGRGPEPGRTGVISPLTAEPRLRTSSISCVTAAVRSPCELAM